MGTNFIFRPPTGQDHMVAAEMLTHQNGPSGKDNGIGVWTEQLDDGTVSIHCELRDRSQEVRDVLSRLGCELLEEQQETN